MTAWDVKEYLIQLTEWDTSEDEGILALCKTSLNEIEARLSATADRSDARISAAAAAIAYFKLTLKRSFGTSGGEVTSFTAGDVSITQNTADNSKQQLENAQKLYEKALESIAPLCEDNSFAFENILIKVTP